MTPDLAREVTSQNFSYHFCFFFAFFSTRERIEIKDHREARETFYHFLQLLLLYSVIIRKKSACGRGFVSHPHPSSSLLSCFSGEFPRSH